MQSAHRFAQLAQRGVGFQCRLDSHDGEAVILGQNAALDRVGDAMGYPAAYEHDALFDGNDRSALEPKRRHLEPKRLHSEPKRRPHPSGAETSPNGAVMATPEAGKGK